MLDGVIRPLIEKPLTQLARGVASSGISANSVTLAGLVIGLACAAAIAVGHDTIALAFLIINRVADGLDGALARIRGATDRGGYLDIVLDFAFYGAVPLAFVLRDPALNGVAGGVLLFAFYVNGASFLAFAAMAAKRSLETKCRGLKSIYFSAGLIEGTETILCFVLMLLFPDWFAALALIFAGLTLLTALGRIILAWTTFA
jgi:phosphatidylglycerophosphate synthase